MIEEAYYYGLTPKEVTELSAAEVAVFIEVRRRRLLDDQKMLAQMSYSAGVLGSMALAKKMPKFEQVFKFPDDVKKEVTKTDIERSKLEMMALAANLNAQVQRSKKEVEDA